MASAVVTGAGRGIGREVARRLAARGYDVLVTDVDEQGARETAEQIGARAWSMAQDVRDPGSHREVARAARERGPIAVWVNNAGVLRTDKAWEHSDDDVRLLTDVNVLGVLWGSRAAVEAMRASGGGHLVNLASMSSFGPVPGLAVYGATKHAVLGFSLSLQGDLEEAGIPIRVHAICPEGVDTGMVRERADEPDSALIFSGVRLYTPEEVADGVMETIDGTKLIFTLPRRTAWMSRWAAAYPRTGLKVIRQLRKAGDRRRQKALGS